MVDSAGPAAYDSLEMRVKVLEEKAEALRERGVLLEYSHPRRSSVRWNESFSGWQQWSYTGVTWGSGWRKRRDGFQSNVQDPVPEVDETDTAWVSSDWHASALEVHEEDSKNLVLDEDFEMRLSKLEARVLDLEQKVAVSKRDVDLLQQYRPST